MCRRLGPLLIRVDGAGVSGDQALMECILHERSRIRLPPQSRGVGLILSEQEFWIALAIQGSVTKFLMGGLDRSLFQQSKCRLRSILFPRPCVPKPQRRENMKFRCFGTPIV